MKTNVEEIVLSQIAINELCERQQQAALDFQGANDSTEKSRRQERVEDLGEKINAEVAKRDALYAKELSSRVANLRQKQSAQHAANNDLMKSIKPGSTASLIEDHLQQVSKLIAASGGFAAVPEFTPTRMSEYVTRVVSGLTHVPDVNAELQREIEIALTIAISR